MEIYQPLLRDNLQHEGFVTLYGNNNRSPTPRELSEGKHRGKVAHLNQVEMESPQLQKNPKPRDATLQQRCNQRELGEAEAALVQEQARQEHRPQNCTQ